MFFFCVPARMGTTSWPKELRHVSRLTGACCGSHQRACAALALWTCVIFHSTSNHVNWSLGPGLTTYMRLEWNDWQLTNSNHNPRFWRSACGKCFETRVRNYHYRHDERPNRRIKKNIRIVIVRTYLYDVQHVSFLRILAGSILTWPIYCDRTGNLGSQMPSAHYFV